MIPLNFILCCFLLLLIPIAKALIPPVMHGYFIRDLAASTSQTEFSALASQWVLTVPAGVNSSQRVFSCGVPALAHIGGPVMSSGGYLERTYSGLLPHKVIHFYFKVFLNIDWQDSDTITFEVNGLKVFQMNPKLYLTPDIYAMYYCSDPSAIYSYTVVGRMLHNSSTLNLRYSSSLSTNASWFGIRDVLITLVSEVQEGYKQEAFVKTFNSFISIPNVNPCGSLKYPNSLGTCSGCSAACRICYNDTESDCYICQTGLNYDGESCVSTCPTECTYCNPQTHQCTLCPSNRYLYWNYTCKSTCGAPYVPEVLGTFKVCKTPCQPDNYMIWDNTCRSSCNFPLVERKAGEAKFCDFPCGKDQYLSLDGTCLDSCTTNPRAEAGVKFCDMCYKPGNFYYQNTTCLPVCNPPMIQRIEGGFSYCDFPCGKNSGKFLYWNGSCLDNCNVNPRYEGGEKYCDACQPGLFLYENDTCLPTCGSLMVQKTEGGYSFCKFPCDHRALIYYYTKHGVCKQYCDYPLQVHDTAFCSVAISEDGLKQAQAITVVINVGADISSSNAALASLLNSNDPSAFSIISLVKMLQSMKYIKIRYPPKLETSFSEQKPESGISKLSPSMSQDMEERFVLHSPIENFTNHKLHSSFLVSFWKPLFALLLLLAILGLFIVGKKISTKHKRVNAFCKKAEQALKWNFMIAFFSIFYDELVIYTSLHLRTSEFNSFFSISSWIICLVMNILGIAIIVKAFLIIRDIMRQKKYFARMDQKVEEKWEKYQVFFTPYKDISWLTQAFFPIFIIRVYLFSFVLAYLFDYPLAQSSLLMTLSILFLIYLVKSRPFKQKIAFFQYVIQEAIIFSISICILILAVMDRNGVKWERSQEIIGDLILICSSIFSLSGALFLVIRNVMKIWELYKAYRSNKKFKTQATVDPPETIMNSTIQDSCNLKQPEPARISKVAITAALFRRIKPNVTLKPSTFNDNPMQSEVLSDKMQESFE